jgi:hypothetical protein
MSTLILRTLAVRISSRRALASHMAIGAALLALFVATPVRADFEAPVLVPIHESVVPGQPINLFFGEVPDPIDHKNLLFEGTASTIPGAVGNLEIQFDWFDPNTGGFVFSPAFPLQVIGGTPTTFSIPWEIPFCPPEVSLHLSNVGPVPGVPIQVDGTFTYQCVPEPSTFVLFGLALASLAGYRLRKRQA